MAQLAGLFLLFRLYHFLLFLSNFDKIKNLLNAPGYKNNIIINNNWEQNPVAKLKGFAAGAYILVGMRHRIFIAINLPEEIKKQLSFYQSKWPELPCRWTKKENLHITLAFLGYVKDEELLDVFKSVREVASRNEPFLINLKKICYGPSNHKKFVTGQTTDKKPARMVWVKGEKSVELTNLQKDLENSLTGKISGFGKERRAFVPHLTLGRIKQWEFRQIEPEERPEIKEEIALNFEVKSIEIMESKLKPQGPDYFILESVALAGTK